MRQGLALAALLALVLVAYGPAVPAFFVSDDLDMLAGDASDLFSPASGFGRFMPVAAAAHRAVAATSGLDPIPPHLGQLALHGTAALLVFALARLLGLGIPVAWSAASLWALYPRHHQVVMWFGAVSIGLSAVFGLAAACLFVAAWRGGRARWGWLMVLAYALALLAHESAVALPLLAAALAVYLSVHGQAARRRRLPSWAWAALAVCLTHLAALAWAYRTRAALYPDSGYRFLGVSGELALAPARYAAWLVTPPPWTDAWTAGALGIALGALALGLAAPWAWRGGALARLGAVWTASAAAPAVLFGVYGVADRYFYLPGVGLALAVAAWLGARRTARVAIVVYTAVAVLLLAQAAAAWRAAGASVQDTLAYLGAWAATVSGPPPAGVLFVAVPFKQGEQWPASQVYVFSTGIVGAAHLATRWPELRVSYNFADEYPTLPTQLAALPVAAGPQGLYLFALEPARTDYTARLGAALPLLAPLRWRGGSRLPVDWGRYAGEAGAASP